MYMAIDLIGNNITGDANNNRNEFQSLVFLRIFKWYYFDCYLCLSNMVLSRRYVSKFIRTA